MSILPWDVRSICAKNPPRSNTVIRSWQLQYPCQPNEPNGCKTFMRGFMGVSGKAQSAGGEGEVLFSVPWIWLVVFVFFWFWWCWWWCLQFFPLKGGWGHHPWYKCPILIWRQISSPGICTPYFTPPWWSFIWQLRFPWIAWTWSVENVCSLRKYPIGLNKKGAAAPTSSPIL